MGTPLFIAVLHTGVKIWKPPKCSVIDVVILRCYKKTWSLGVCGKFGTGGYYVKRTSEGGGQI